MPSTIELLQTISESRSRRIAHLLMVLSALAQIEVAK